MKNSNKVLVNKGLLKFTKNGITTEIENQNDSSVKVIVNTGDNTSVMRLFITSIISLSTIVFVTFKRKKEII